MQFVDVRNDIAFKKIFGNENKKEILMSFLNSVLGLSGDREIDDLTILNPWQAPEIPSLKHTMLDIRAIDKRKVTFIVEIQVQKKFGFEKRVQYYTSKAYAAQLKEGDDYHTLNQVIFIGIVEFNIYDGDDYLTNHKILNTSTYKQELADLEFYFIELPKFTRTEDKLESITDKWIHFIKNAVSLHMIPKCADFVELKEAYDIANKMTWNEKELEIYDYWQMRSKDEVGVFMDGERKGLIEGERRGLIEGERKGLVKGKIEGMLEIKYGYEGLALMDSIRGIEDIKRLEELKGLIKGAASIEELRGFL
ncbi:transposase [Candidatus Magnetobacterium bavaricum]|uniref:Transposase n=1 Tax=Candidatus Magnetobacterium bavaricum TaxID=29290 RepID=A0A0F3GSW8_9BACT|nr:transposase [Candidatus Magnetobacterium bavaricum]